MNGLTFGAPLALAAFLVWPLLLFVVRTRQARTPRPAPDFELWRRAAARLSAPSTTRTFGAKDAVLLIPALLLHAALSAPSIVGGAANPVYVVLDRSASMTAVDESGESRARRALREAAALSIGRSIVVVGAPPPIFDEQMDEAAAAVGRPDELSALARTHRELGRDVIVASDRFDVALPDGVGRVVVSDAVRNAGIVACVFDGADVFVRTEADSGAGARELVVRESDGREIARRSFADASGGRFLIDAGDATEVVVALEPSDAASFDDAVRLVRSAGRKRVSVVGEGMESIRRALAAQPETDVAAGFDPSADLVACRGGVALRNGVPAIFVAPFQESRGFSCGVATPATGPIQTAPAFDGVFTGGAPLPPVHAVAASPAGAEVLGRSGDAPLILRSKDAVAFFFDPEGSTWTTTPGFPVAMRRVVEGFGLLSTPSTRPDGDFLSSGRRSDVFDRGETELASRHPPARTPFAASSERGALPLQKWLAFAAAGAVCLLVGAPILRGRARPRIDGRSRGEGTAD